MAARRWAALLACLLALDLSGVVVAQYQAGGLIPHSHASAASGGTLAAAAITAAGGVLRAGNNVFTSSNTFSGGVFGIIRTGAQTAGTGSSAVSASNAYGNGWTAVGRNDVASVISSSFTSLTSGRSYRLRYNFYNSAAVVKPYLVFNGDWAGNYDTSCQVNVGSAWATPGGAGAGSGSATLSDTGNGVTASTFFAGDILFESSTLSSHRVIGRYRTTEIRGGGSTLETLDCVVNYNGAADLSSVAIVVTGGTYSGHAVIEQFTEPATW